MNNVRRFSTTRVALSDSQNHNSRVASKVSRPPLHKLVACVAQWWMRWRMWPIFPPSFLLDFCASLKINQINLRGLLYLKFHPYSLYCDF